MKKSDVVDAIVKMAVTKIEDAEGNMVPMTGRTMTVKFNEMTYPEVKETFFEMMDEFMDEYGEDKVPDEFGNLYNTLTDEPEGTEPDPEPEDESREKPKAEEELRPRVEAEPEKRERKRRRTKAEIEAEKAAKAPKNEGMGVGKPQPFKVLRGTPPIESDPRDIAGERISAVSFEPAKIAPIDINVKISGNIQVVFRIETEK